MKLTRLVTYTGRRVDPLNLRAVDVCIEDIAHALALINRFAGHTPKPYTVAQHCVFVSRLCHPAHALAGLLHDAAEAYLGDVTKWVKQSPGMTFFRDCENHAQLSCYLGLKVPRREYFMYPNLMAPDVEAADKLMVRYEGLKAYGPNWETFAHPEYPAPTPEEIKRIGNWKPWSWQVAEDYFLQRYEELQ